MWRDFWLFYIKGTLPGTRIIWIFTTGLLVWPTLPVVAFWALCKIWSGFLCFVCFKLCKNSVYPALYQLIEPWLSRLVLDAWQSTVYTLRTEGFKTARVNTADYAKLCVLSFLPTKQEKSQCTSRPEVQFWVYMLIYGVCCFWICLHSW